MYVTLFYISSLMTTSISCTVTHRSEVVTAWNVQWQIQGTRECISYSFVHAANTYGRPVLSCPCRRCDQNWRQDKTILCCLDPVSNLQLFSVKYIEDYWKIGNWKLSCLVSDCVHTADMDKTRQFCLVRVGGVNKLLGVCKRSRPNDIFTYSERLRATMQAKFIAR